MYLASQEGFYVSPDGGETWTPKNDGLETLDLRSLRVAAGSAGTFAENVEEDAGNRVLRGSGHAWARAGNPLWSDYTFQARIRLLEGTLHTNVRVSDDGRYFLGLNEGGLYLKKQFDQWSTFADLTDAPGPVSLDTWHAQSTGMPAEQWPYTIAIDDEDPQIMYVSTKNGQNKGFCHRNEFCGVVMKSTNGGAGWTAIMDGLPAKSEYYRLLIYPENHDVLFLSTSNGVYWSRNAGAAWDPLNEGLPATHNVVRDNVADNLTFTADHRYLLLGLVGHGVWRADLSRLPLTR